MFLKPMFAHWAVKSKHKLQFFESGTVFHKQFKMAFFSNLVPPNGQNLRSKLTSHKFFPLHMPIWRQYVREKCYLVSCMKNSATLKKLQFVFRFYSPMCKHRFQKHNLHIIFYRKRYTCNAIFFLKYVYSSSCFSLAF